MYSSVSQIICLFSVTCSASPINNAIPFNASIAEGEDVIYACETGYSYSSGNLSRTCTVNGTLSGTDPTCSSKSK